MARYENKIVIVAQYFKSGNWPGAGLLKVKKLLTDPSDEEVEVEMGDETQPSGKLLHSDFCSGAIHKLCHAGVEEGAHAV